MEILIGLSSLLGGGLLTAFIFIFAFSNKVSVMQSTLNRVEKSFNDHVGSVPTCAFHNKVSSDIEVLKSQMESKT